MPYVNSDGVNIYYEEYGRGLPLVFLHPFSTNGYIWYFQIFTFALTNRCVVIDERGHGRSDKPRAGYAIPRMARDVAAVFDALKIERAVLIGNSIGGMIALQFNLDYPERVAGNVIVSSATGLSRELPAGTMAAFERDYEGTFGSLIEGTVSAKSKRERGEILDVMKSQFRVEANFPRHVFNASTQDPEGVFNWDITDRLSRIRKPTLIFAGEEDFGTPVALNKVLADNIPGAELRVLKDIGHYYHLEQPREFNAELRRFIEKLPA